MVQHFSVVEIRQTPIDPYPAIGTAGEEDSWNIDYLVVEYTTWWKNVKFRQTKESRSGDGVITSGGSTFIGGST